MDDLDGDTAIVTGAAQGFGERIAHRLGAAGANVVLADIQNKKARSVAEGLQDAGVSAAAIRTDVTDRASVARMVEETVDRFGPVHILVNNAGGSGSERFQDLDLKTWQGGIDLNLTAPFICTSAVAPLMQEHGNGRIVNISSMAGRNVTMHGNPSYTSAKWGLLGLTKHAARDLAPDVRINAICPGGSTDVPVGFPLEPEHVADAVHFLVSDRSEFVNATFLELDGGDHLSERPEYLEKPPEKWPDEMQPAVGEPDDSG